MWKAGVQTYWKQCVCYLISEVKMQLYKNSVSKIKVFKRVRVLLWSKVRGRAVVRSCVQGPQRQSHPRLQHTAMCFSRTVHSPICKLIFLTQPQLSFFNNSLSIQKRLALKHLCRNLDHEHCTMYMRKSSPYPVIPSRNLVEKIHSFLNLNIMRWKVCGRLRSERPLKPQLAKILLPYIWCWNRIMHSCGFEVVWCYEIWPAASFARISRSWIDRRSQATWEKPILKWRRLSDIQFLYNYIIMIINN